MKIKTSELIGMQLDWAVAKADRDEMPATWQWIEWDDYHPSTNWSQGGPLIESHAIGFVGHDADNWLAFSSPCDETHQGIGPTHLIAACRMIVSAKLGEEIEVPEELV